MTSLHLVSPTTFLESFIMPNKPTDNASSLRFFIKKMQTCVLFIDIGGNYKKNSTQQK